MKATRTPGAIVPLDALNGLDVRPVPDAMEHFATEDGRVLSCARAGVLRERRPTPNHGGYLTVFVARHGRMANHPVHRMVAEAFHGPKPSPDHEVRHLDGNRTNNRPANLAWGTRRENIDDRERHGTTARGARNGAYTKPERVRRGDDNGRAVLTAAQVTEVRRRLDAGNLRADIARDLGVAWNVIDRIARGVTWRPIAEEDARRTVNEGSTTGAA